MSRKQMLEKLEDLVDREWRNADSLEEIRTASEVLNFILGMIEREDRENLDITARAMKDRARTAATGFFERKGFDVLEEDFHGWMVIENKEGLALVKLCVTAHDMPSTAVSKADRKKFERLMAEYLETKNEMREGRVRMDMLDLKVLANERALLRHHINALGE